MWGRRLEDGSVANSEDWAAVRAGMRKGEELPTVRGRRSYEKGQSNWERREEENGSHREAV